MLLNLVQTRAAEQFQTPLPVEEPSATYSAPADGSVGSQVRRFYIITPSPEDRRQIKGERLEGFLPSQTRHL